eukprot:scaffold169766_cov19-Tisochrysis_lutea.AAC.1
MHTSQPGMLTSSELPTSARKTKTTGNILGCWLFPLAAAAAALYPVVAPACRSSHSWTRLRRQWLDWVEGEDQATPGLAVPEQ